MKESQVEQRKCEQCGLREERRIETVIQGEVTREGFKCENCRRWNWLPQWPDDFRGFGVTVKW